MTTSDGTFGVKKYKPKVESRTLLVIDYLLYLALRVALLGHEGEERPSVVVGLLLGRRPGVLAVVGQLWGRIFMLKSTYPVRK